MAVARKKRTNICELPLTENQEQRLLVKWIRNDLKLGDYLIKYNNEGDRTAGQVQNLKLMGMLSGVSDLLLAMPSSDGKFHGLWLECKRNKTYYPSERNRPTWLAQEKFLTDMKKVGYHAEMCYGAEHGKIIVMTYLSIPFTTRAD